MAKKDTLYSVNNWNIPLFMPKEERKNLFSEGGTTGLDLMNLQANAPITPNLPRIDAKLGLGNKIKGTLGALKGAGGTPIGGVVGALGSAVGKAGGSLISGGLSSGAGSAISNIGGTVGSALSQVNPVLGAAVSAASGIIGGGVNALVGTAVNQEKLNAAKEGTSQLNSFTSSAQSIDNIAGPQAVANVEDAYRGGLLKKGWAAKKNAAVREARVDARNFAFNSVENNIDNIVDDQMNDQLANYAAFGGPLGGNSIDGALDYGLATDYLLYKKKQAQNKDTMSNLFMSTPKGLFSFGGDMQTNGGDYPTGLRHIDAGGSHEENPYDGVQQGVDSEGVPNLVEEGETVYNDYVFSKRILADENTKKKLHLPKKQDITFADISKKLEKELSERPNDPISKATFKSQMQLLEEEQERQKQELDAAKAQALFASMSPEEQAALMQQVVQQQEAVAQQQEAQTISPEEAMMQQQSQPSEEALMAVQQQANMADGSTAHLGAEPQLNACGGHLYKRGGELLEKIGNIHTLSDFKKWLKDHKVEGIDYDSYDHLDDTFVDALLSNDSFKEALKKETPSLYHALSEGYDWGAYQQPKNRINFGTITKGNWKATDGAGWLGSDDAAFLEATKGMSNDDIKRLSSQQLADLMKATDAYKKGTEWLQDADHALFYLNTITNDPDTPQAAKDYAKKYVQDGQWKDGFSYDYGTVFGKDGKGVRETNPGTYWHLPKEVTMTNVTRNFVRRPDGSVEAIIGDVPRDWRLSDTYTWMSQKDNSNNTYNYYSVPEAVKVTETPVAGDQAEADATSLEPVIPKDYLRYAGLFGPAVGLTLQGFGLGKPDYSQVDAAVAGAGNVALAGRKDIGNYLTYRPMDIWFEQNKAAADARATDRALINTAAPTGAKAASLLASGYNNQIANGELYKKALEYNDQKQQQVAEFNRATDQFNADAYNRQSQFNASAQNDAIGRATSAKLQAAQTKLNNNAGWYNGIYGNVGQLFKGLSDLGKERTATGWRNALATSGAYGVLDEDALVAVGMAKRKENKTSEGGSIERKKRRGMTF